MVRDLFCLIDYFHDRFCRIGSFIGHKGAVWGATITGNAELAATAGSDFTAKLWDANTGAELQTFEHKHIVRSVDFSSINKEWLLTASNEKLIKIYDVTAPTGLFVYLLINLKIDFY